jgi:hypothetical protein
MLGLLIVWFCFACASTDPHGVREFDSLKNLGLAAEPVYDVLDVKVNIQFYLDAACTVYANERTFELGDCSSESGECSQDCFAWNRTVNGGGYHENSSNKWLCFRNWGVTYVQFKLNSECGGEIVDSKRARVGCCVPEPSGGMFSFITEADAASFADCALHPTEDDDSAFGCALPTVDTLPPRAIRNAQSDGWLEFGIIVIASVLLFACCLYLGKQVAMRISSSASPDRRSYKPVKDKQDIARLTRLAADTSMAPLSSAARGVDNSMGKYEVTDGGDDDLDGSEVE